MVPPTQQQWLRGPWNDLHAAAFDGSTQRTKALLSRGLINIDQGAPKGATPLMVAAQRGHSGVAKILLSRKANLSIVECDGATALHLSAQSGHLAATVVLVEAGADLEARNFEGCTPLHLATNSDHSRVMAALIKAGADVDTRRKDGATPLCIAGYIGSLAAVKQLLRAKANPLLASMDSKGFGHLPLDKAAEKGHAKVVHELISQVGMEGCGGASGGVNSLAAAAMHSHLDTMAVLMDAGVVDPGPALLDAAGCGREAAVKLLLQQRHPGPIVDYVNFCDSSGMTPLLHSVYRYSGEEDLPSLVYPKVLRLLIDAGANTSSAVRVTKTRGGEVLFNGTLLAFINDCLQKKQVRDGKDATEEQLHRLVAVRRLLLRVEAVHAISWLWPREPRPIIGGVDQVSSRRTATTTPANSAQLASMLPILRRRRRGVLLAPLLRYSRYP